MIKLGNIEKCSTHPAHRLMKMKREDKCQKMLYVSSCYIDITYDHDEGDDDSTKNSNCKTAEMNIYSLWWSF